MIRNKVGIILGAGAAALAIGVFGGIRPANAAVMNPQAHSQIRPYIEYGWGNSYGPNWDRDHRRFDRDNYDWNRNWERDHRRFEHRDWDRDHRDRDRDNRDWNRH